VYYATCAKLLNYPDTAGAAGRRLRPEIAAGMPTVSRHGRTYTIRLRPGFRFSPPSNEPVTAETFRHSIERVLAPKRVFGPAWPLLPEIAGMSAYRAGEAAHVSGIVAHGNTLSITLVRPAGDFLTRLSMDTFCPVPLGEPVPPPSGPAHPIPSVGPYYVSSIESNRVVLERNPNYRGPRPRRSARIVYTLDLKSQEAVALADGGAIDYMPPDWDDNSLLVPGGVLERRYGPTSAAAAAGNQRYFLYPIPAVDAVLFNTRRPLFRNPRLRRAVAFALDRPALAAAYFDAPNAQVIPPGVPGHRAGSLYPLGGPDLVIARRLAGVRSSSAVLYSCSPDPAERRVADIVRSNLARIHINVSILQSQGCFQGPDPAVKRADLVLTSFLLGPANRDPGAFLDMALGGLYGSARLGPGPWNEAGFRRRVEAARALDGPARTAVYGRLADELSRQAPFAVYGSFVRGEYFAPGVGCRISQAEYGFADLGALCKS
jgi:ABC-type transport system substrate-binding protein